MPVALASYRMQTPIGTLVLSGDERGVRDIAFSDDACGDGECPEALRLCARQLQEYFDGTRREFSDVALASSGTDFQQQVWDAASDVPWGETATYGDLASAVGNPEASRAVGTALGRNPLCIIVPCHRIITSQGSCGGYAWGTWRKEWLLNHESSSS